MVSSEKKCEPNLSVFWAKIFVGLRVCVHACAHHNISWILNSFSQLDTKCQKSFVTSVFVALLPPLTLFLLFLFLSLLDFTISLFLSLLIWAFKLCSWSFGLCQVLVDWSEWWCEIDVKWYVIGARDRATEMPKNQKWRICIFRNSGKKILPYKSRYTN